jgi:hypothetical protein
MRIHQKNEINGWENIISNEIDLDASNLRFNMFTYNKKIKLYEYSSTLRK